ncbi:pyridine nucleotide-disulfide oxidoreductase domain-containing protein [Sarocladium implicatum]|nr:pyridine nucleotide-disulfide oxidoreductase domain-containing protein [Sarocladium implicatum]
MSPARTLVSVASLESGIPHVPVFDQEDQIDAAKEASIFIDRLSSAISNEDWDAFGDLFLEDVAWWRDSLSLTFDRRTLRGRDAIVEAWREMAPTKKPTDFTIDENATYLLKPTWHRMAPQLATLDVPFAFKTETPAMNNVAVAKLVPVHHGDKIEYKIWICRSAADSLISHEFEQLPRQRPSTIKASQRGQPHSQGLPNLSPHDVLDAVVVGGSMSGLANAIMLEAGGADIAVFESEACVGQNWANRYNGATLHHDKGMVQLPFFPVPKNGDYSEFMTGPQLRNYCTAAVAELKLPVFTGVSVSSSSFDRSKKIWSILVTDVKTGQEGTLLARNLVLATGFIVNKDNINKPTLENQHLFKGPVQHSEEYRTAAPYKDGHAIVVGSGNSAHDIAKDLALNGAASVTILQRSPTALYDFKDVFPIVSAPFKMTSTVEAADFVGQTLPTAVARDFMTGVAAAKIEELKDRYQELESKGYMVDRTANLMVRAIENRGRSFYMDQPRVFDLVMRDQIRIARGEAQCFTEGGIVVRDPQSQEEKILQADGVVMATGYKNIDLPKLYQQTGFLDSETAASLVNVGMAGGDAEGELPGVATSSGHDHLYFASFGVLYSRVISRQVALQVIADVSEGKVTRLPRS